MNPNCPRCHGEGYVWTQTRSFSGKRLVPYLVNCPVCNAAPSPEKTEPTKPKRSKK